VTGVGKVGFLIAALCFIVAAAVRFILGAWIPFLYLLVALAGVALVVSMFFDRKIYLEFFTLRTTKHGMNMGAMILLVLGLLVCVNYLAVRHNKTFDLTTEKLNSLSDQSVKVLDSLDSDLEVKVFYKGAEALPARQAVNQSLNLYEEKSSRFKVRFIDSYVDNMLAQEYLSPLPDRDQSSVFVFVEYNGKRVRVEGEAAPAGFSEEQITQALVKVTRRGEKKIYFLIGHGEKDLNSESAQGLRALKDQLTSASFNLEELNLIEKASVPEDAALVAVIGPKQALLDNELVVLENYVQRGGKILLALDPGEKHNLSQLSRKMGVEFKNNFVIFLDPTKGQASGSSIGVTFSQDNPITAPLIEGKTLTLFDLTSELAVDPQKSALIEVTPLVNTAPSSFTMQELKNEVKSPPIQKAYPIFMFSTGKLKEGEEEKAFKAVIVGDSDFLSNRLLLVGSNRDLALNSFAELTDQKDLISIRPKQEAGNKLLLTGPIQLGMISAGVSLPVLLLLLSGLLWYRRRGA